VAKIENGDKTTQKVQQSDLYKHFNFQLEVDGITCAAFHEAIWSDSSIRTRERRKWGDETPDLPNSPNITLKWGMTDNFDLYNWYQQWLKGNTSVPRKNGSIILKDRQRKEKVRWNFFNARPVKWVGSSFAAQGNDLAININILELIHEGIERV